jgi:hypothetical protein
VVEVRVGNRDVRKVRKGPLRAKEGIEGGLTFLVFAFLGSFFPFLVLQRTVPWFDQHLGLIAAALAACSVYALWRQGRMLPTGPRRALNKDLEQGLVDDLHFEVVEALVVQEQEDEGPGYYLKLVDGRVLFLRGPYLTDAEEEGFPRARLCAARARESRTLLQLRCDGPPVPVAGRLPGFGPEDGKADRAPLDGALLDIDFEALKERASAVEGERA